MEKFPKILEMREGSVTILYYYIVQSTALYTYIYTIYIVLYIYSRQRRFHFLEEYYSTGSCTVVQAATTGPLSTFLAALLQLMLMYIITLQLHQQSQYNYNALTLCKLVKQSSRHQTVLVLSARPYSGTVYILPTVDCSRRVCYFLRCAQRDLKDLDE